MDPHIDSNPLPTADIYVHASRTNPFYSGWGAVIVDQWGSPRELYASGEGKELGALFLIGCNEALRSLPNEVSVRVHCASNYPTVWCLDRLPMFRANGFTSKAKHGLANAELLRSLDGLVVHRPHVEAITVGKGDLCLHHKRAVMLAKLNGEQEAISLPVLKTGIRWKPGEPEDFEY